MASQFWLDQLSKTAYYVLYHFVTYKKYQTKLAIFMTMGPSIVWGPLKQQKRHLPGPIWTRILKGELPRPSRKSRRAEVQPGE